MNSSGLRLLISVFVGLAALGTAQMAPNKALIGRGNSDEFAETNLVATSASRGLLVSESDHKRIKSILGTTRQMIDTAKALMANESTLQEGRDMMVKASTMFRDLKAGLQKNVIHQDNSPTNEEEDRSLLRHKYAGHDVKAAEGNDDRALGVVRDLYETLVTFPECLEQLFETCLEIINSELNSLGLTTIEVVVHEKRNRNQDGYNKVVIITNELADRVAGKAHDGIVQYPFLWDDAATGPRTLGVDGKWNCHDMTPESCCQTIKASAASPDTSGKYLECHIFVPYGAVGNPRHNDRVFINLSSDGRVHEAPIIQ